MPDNFAIRPAKLEDRPVLVTLMQSLQDAEREFHSNRSLGSEIADSHLAYLEELVENQNGQIYVAASDKDIFGFVVCFVETLDEGDLYVVESAREYGYISDLYVIPTMRKYGIGAALMQAVEQHFFTLNLAVVRVGLLYSNESAAKFYRNVGYQPYEIVYEKYLEH